MAALNFIGLLFHIDQPWVFLFATYMNKFGCHSSWLTF